MLKKPVFWIIVLAVLLSVPLFYYTFMREEIHLSDPLEAVPQDAVLVFRSKELMKKIRQRQDNEIWNELCRFPAINKINAQLNYFDSVANTSQFIRDFFKQQETLFSVHPAGKNRYELIWYFPIPERNNEKQILEFFNKQVENKGQVTERKYETRTIYEVDISGKRHQNFSFTIDNGLLIISHSAILVEGAIRQLDLDNPLNNQPEFKNVAITAGKNVDANLYINLRTVPRLLSGLFSDIYRERLAGSDDLAIWSVLDVNLKYDALLLNGFTSINPDKNLFLNIFREQTPQRSEIQKVIPADFATYMAFELDNYSDFKKKYDNYLDIKGSLRNRQQAIRQVNENYGIDIERTFTDIIEQELALIVTDIKDISLDENTFFAVRCKNQTLAMEALESMLEQISSNKHLPFSQMVFEQTITNDFKQKFYQIPLPDPGNYIAGSLFTGTNNNYCTFIDNYLIFGKSINALSEYVYLNMLQSTLGSDLDFNRLSDYLAARSNIHLLINISHATALMEKYLSVQSVMNLEKNLASLQKFKTFSYQLSMENNLVYNNSFLKYSAQVKEEPRTEWASRLDNSVAGKPSLVTNHYTNDREIFLQDQKNKIYLINNSGRVLWKMELQGKINSDIYQIDYYKNGKLQLMFSTENQIHLIDRNGNYIENYPLNLRAHATTGMAVFDYEGNRDYRIFVPETDHRIYAYDVKGTLLSGWDFDKTDDPVYQPVQHYRIGDKDYLVCTDKYNIYILDRRGQKRVNVKEHFPVSQRNNCILDKGSLNTDPRLVLTDTSGHVHFIYFTGETEELSLGNFSSGHYFNYQDLNGDGSKEFIFLDKNELTVINQDRSRLFSRMFHADISFKPAIYQFSDSDYKIGLTVADEQRIYLVNKDGSLYKGFPLAGSTMFSIGLFSSSSNNFNLVVGGSDNFLYNYSVN